MKWELLPISNDEFLISNQTPNPNSQITNYKLRTVYAKFYTAYGAASETVSDSIILKANTTENQTENTTNQNSENNSDNANNNSEIPFVAPEPLAEAGTQTPNNPNNSTSPQPPVFTQALQFGSNNADVKNLQDKLKKLNFFPKEIISNGNFGLATKQAVMDYQKSKGINPNGIVGPRTRKALNGEEFITNKDYQFTQDLKYNDKNEDVKQL